MLLKENINKTEGPLKQEELDFLKKELEQRNTASLIIRHNSLVGIKRTTKTDKAEFLLIQSILKKRDSN